VTPSISTLKFDPDANVMLPELKISGLAPGATMPPVPALMSPVIVPLPCSKSPLAILFIVPERDPLIVNVSAPTPPVKFSILLKPLVLPISIPTLEPVIVNAFPSASPNRVLFPETPSTDPVKLPVFVKVKLSSPSPPTRFSMLLNPLVLPTRVPALEPLTEKSLPSASPKRVSLPVLPSIVPVTLPPS